jgi:hypothetical protein
MSSPGADGGAGFDSLRYTGQNSSDNATVYGYATGNLTFTANRWYIYRRGLTPEEF